MASICQALVLCQECSKFFAGVISSDDPPNLRSGLKSILFLELRKSKHRNAKLPVKGRKTWRDFTADLTAPSALVEPGAEGMKAGEVVLKGVYETSHALYPAPIYQSGEL